MDTQTPRRTPLPAGLAVRPLRPADAAAVTAVMAAQELADTGEVYIEEADIVADWSRPSFDLEASTVGVFEGDELVGYAEVSLADRGDAAVRPDRRGRGIGTWLAGWMQDLARHRGDAAVGMPVPAGSAGETLLRSLGYRERWTSWTLELPGTAVIPDRPLPEGYAVRAATAADYRAAYTVVEDAFLEWSDRQRQSLEDFSAQVMGRQGFAPWMFRVVTDPSGAVVGAAVILLAQDGVEGYVERLAVRRDQRRRGLAQALLVDAFAQARGQGATKSALSTDSRTGALSLYEKVGMVVTSTWVNLAVDL